MTYLSYIVAAYSVFFVVLIWDFIVPRLQIRKHLRQAQLRQARSQRAKASESPSPLDELAP